MNPSQRLAASLLPETLDFLKEQVEINSHSLNHEGVEGNADVICARFADFGWTERRIASPVEGAGRHLLLDSGHSGPTVFLVSHLDTVFTPQEQSAAGPAWNQEGRRVRGPGTIDNKGGTAMLWLVLRILRETNPEAFRSIRWIAAWNATEEILAPDFASACLRFAPNPKAALVFESDNSATEGKFEIVNRRSGIAKYHLACEGRGAHAGNSHENGRNAITGLASAVLEISGWTDYARNTTVNVGTIRGGEATNRVPDYAEAAFEIRFQDREHFTNLETRLEGLVTAPGCVLRVQKEAEIAPLESAADCLLLENAWQNAGRDLGLNFSIGGRRGLSDANHFSGHSPTLDGLGPRGGNLHGIERLDDRLRITEYLEIDSLVPKARLNARALASLFPVK